METTRNIKWIIRNVTKENIVKFDSAHRIFSPEFQINVTDSISDIWYLLSYVKENCFGVYLYKYSSDHERHENYNVKSTFSTKKVNMKPLEQPLDEYNSAGFGYPELVDIDEMFQEVDSDNCFTIDVEITIKDIQKVGTEIKSEIGSFTRGSTLMSIIHGDVENGDASLTEVLKQINDSSAAHETDDFDLILKVLNAARKFKMPQLQQECTDALSNMINSENALDMLKTAQNLDLPKLEDKVLPFILKHYHTLKTTKKWQKLTIPLRGKIFDAFSGNISSLVLETVL